MLARYTVRILAWWPLHNETGDCSVQLIVGNISILDNQSIIGRRAVWLDNLLTVVNFWKCLVRT